MKITISDRDIGPDFPPYVIAELSANHNGSLENALKSLEAAASCGADAVKLQTYTADTITIQSNMPDFFIQNGPWKNYNLYDLYNEAQTPFEWHADIFEHAKKIGITVFSSPFDETAVDLLEDLGTPAYKIASFEAVDIPLIRYVASTQKPLLISTGMASELEIQEAVEAAYDSGCKELLLLHCVSSYPAPIEQTNLKQMAALLDRFDVPVGLSDHTLGTTVSIAAVALGACLVEKHFILSRDQKGPDSEFSLEPREFSNLCVASREAWSSLGVSSFARPEVEQSNAIFRRSVYFVRDLPKGHIITKEDVRRIRPGFGLAPKFYDDLIGLELNVDVYRGQATNWECFQKK